MAHPVKSSLTEAVRRWQQRLIQTAILFAIAGAVALAWSLLGGILDSGGSRWTLSRPDASAPTASGGRSAASLPAGTSGKAAASGNIASSGNTASGGSTASNGSASGGGTAPSGGSTSSGNNPAATARNALPRVSSEDDIPVYLVGAVVRPGIYIVRRGSYLYEAVDLAGGMTPEAASMSVNLALRLTENQMIRIPTQAEASDPLNPHPIPTGIIATRSNAVNINTATEAELEKLPGVGPAIAAAIVADRKKNGPFKQPEDLMRVAGVKESRYQQIESLITVR